MDDTQFEMQMQNMIEEQKAIERIKERSLKLEQGVLSRKKEAQKIAVELDSIPTRDVSAKKKQQQSS